MNQYMAKYFAALLLTEMKSTDRSIKKARRIGPISSHLDQPSLVNINSNGHIILFKSMVKWGQKEGKRTLFSYFSAWARALVPRRFAALPLSMPPIYSLKTKIRYFSQSNPFVDIRTNTAHFPQLF